MRQKFTWDWHPMDHIHASGNTQPIQLEVVVHTAVHVSYVPS